MDQNPSELLDDKDEFEALDDRDEFVMDVHEAWYSTYNEARRASLRFMENFWRIEISETMDNQGRRLWVMRAER